MQMVEMKSILSGYDLGNPDSVTELKPNRAWRIDHRSGQWVLAKRPMYDAASRRIERLESASRLMTELHHAAQPWVLAKLNRDGRYITVGEESLYQITAFVEGQTDWNNLTLEVIPEIGRAMGAYHRYQETTCDTTLPNFDFHKLVIDGLNTRKDELMSFPVERSPSAADVDAALAEFGKLSERLSDLPSGLIHMDLSPGNVVTQDGVLSGIIDFEAFPAPFLLDIGIAVMYWTATFDPDTADTHINPERLRVLLESYSLERSLSADETSSLKDALIWCAIRWWSRQGSYRKEDPDYRLHSRYDTYRCCQDIDDDWLRSCVA